MVNQIDDNKRIAQVIVNKMVISVQETHRELAIEKEDAFLRHGPTKGS